MPDEPLQDRPDSIPPTLDYGRPQTVNVPAIVGAVLAGAVVGVITIFFAGCGVMNVVGYPLFSEGAARPQVQWWAPILFFILTFVGVAGIIALWRTDRRRWFLQGVLLGVAMMCLLEGFCFANP